MKRTAIAFMTVFALAVCFLAGTAAYIAAHKADLVISGEITAGERGDVDSVAVEQQLMLRQILVWDSVYDPLAGATSTESRRWQTPVVSLSQDDFKFSISSGLASYDSSEKGGELSFSTEAARRIYERIADSSQFEKGAETYFNLDEIVDCVPLIMTSGWDGVSSEDISGVFRVPVPEWLRVEADYDVAGDKERLQISPVPGSAGMLLYSSHTAAGNWLYFTFELRRESSGELLDGSLLPGGDWGVWRVRLPEGRSLSAEDLASAECVYTLGRDWEWARLYPVAVGGQVLLLAQEGGTFYLTAFDAAGGDVAQRLPLGEAGEHDALNGIYIGEGHAAFGIDRDRIVCCSESGGRWTLDFTAANEFPSFPQGRDPSKFFCSTYNDELCYDGEFAYLLRDVTYAPDSDMLLTETDGYLVLTAYDEGGEVYSEWLSSPMRQPRLALLSEVSIVPAE